MPKLAVPLATAATCQATCAFPFCSLIARQQHSRHACQCHQILWHKVERTAEQRWRHTVSGAPCDSQLNSACQSSCSCRCCQAGGMCGCVTSAKRTCRIFQVGAACLQGRKVYQLNMFSGSMAAKAVELAGTNQAGLQTNSSNATAYQPLAVTPCCQHYVTIKLPV